MSESKSKSALNCLVGKTWDVRFECERFSEKAFCLQERLKESLVAAEVREFWLVSLGCLDPLLALFLLCLSEDFNWCELQAFWINLWESEGSSSCPYSFSEEPLIWVHIFFKKSGRGDMNRL